MFSVYVRLNLLREQLAQHCYTWLSAILYKHAVSITHHCLARLEYDKMHLWMSRLRNAIRWETYDGEITDNIVHMAFRRRADAVMFAMRAL